MGVDRGRAGAARAPRAADAVAKLVAQRATLIASRDRLLDAEENRLGVAIADLVDDAPDRPGFLALLTQSRLALAP